MTTDIQAVCRDYSKECIIHEFKLFRETLVNKRNINLDLSQSAESNWDKQDATVLHNQGIFYHKMIKELDKYMENMVDDDQEKTLKL